jgi:hypothetical protein
MNTELKNLISTLFDGEKLVSDVLNKNYASVIMDGMALLGDAPGDISGYSDLQNEIKGLSNAANIADLISFIQQKFSSIEQLSSAKAQAVITAIVGLINAAIAVEQAFVS